ncbi:hypothetical protein Pla22_06640 [Rubripirellula amarantea]|uniref:Uncharacterized protein n=1 Tax=Rubripirellula amarantea TaxID=2527999 RepID=A0A5C5WQH0_9BACT|nr:calcium-binding protein [Rubripirellula amarantea]TWT53036.1 hypothetical protein Pla22_06640 [Rubripirellula amarantea]
MSLMVAIPHYFSSQHKANESLLHGSETVQNRSRRAAVLAKTIRLLHQNFGAAQGMIQIRDRRVIPVNEMTDKLLKVVMVTNHSDHLLGDILGADQVVEHIVVDEPADQLGFACQRVLAESLGQYDHYAYLEDDIWIHDPLLITKLSWFVEMTSPRNVLQPNRYECQASGKLRKCYIDGDVSSAATASFQDISDTPFLDGRALGRSIRFMRPLNPHSGCYFLSSEQLEHWSKQTDFAIPTSAFVGPLESAATLGLMKHFRVYKPVPAHASFAEIEHGDARFIQHVV